MRIDKDFWNECKFVLQLAIPVSLGQIGQMLTGLADTVMVGHLGAVPLGASAFANMIFINFLVFGIGLAYALTPLIGTAFGENDNTKIKSLLANSLTINILVAIILTIAMFAISPLMRSMNQPKEVAEMAIPFFWLLTGSLIPVIIFITLKQFTEGLEDTKPAMYISIIGNLANVLLNYLCIYGKWGFPEMGANGASFATLVTRILMAIAFVIYLKTNAKYKDFMPTFSLSWLNIPTMKKLFSMGFPMGLQALMEVISFTMGTMLAGWLGTIQLAAHQIVITLVSMTYMSITGVASAATIRVSVEMGKHQLDKVWTAAKGSVGIAALYMLLCGVGLVLFKDFLPQFFVDAAKSESAEVIALSASLMLIAAMFQLFDGIQVVAHGCLRGIQDVKIPTAVNFISYWLLALPSGYFLAFHAGFDVAGIWYGYLIGLSVTSILLVIRFIYSYNKLKISLP